MENEMFSLNKNYIKSAVCNDIDSDFSIYRELIIDEITESYDLPELINNLENCLETARELELFIDSDIDDES